MKDEQEVKNWHDVERQLSRQVTISRLEPGLGVTVRTVGR